MKEKWTTINERIFSMEKVPESERDEKWIKEWNELISISEKTAGCVERKRYNEKDKRREEKGKGRDVEGLP